MARRDDPRPTCPFINLGVALPLALAAFIVTQHFLSARTDSSGWGVDAVLSRHIEPAALPGYVELLEQADVPWVRERVPAIPAVDSEARVGAALSVLHAAGKRILLFAQETSPPASSEWGPFTPNIVEVFSEGKQLQQRNAQYYPVWELHNEPDLGWWPDMPDRYAAHAAALYLGLKSGGVATGGEGAKVLLGSLGLAPGPWLERAAASGMLAYGDAWNVHYYGEVSQFTGFLAAHERAMRDLVRGSVAEHVISRWPVKGAFRVGGGRTGGAWGQQQPIWVTESGYATVTAATWADAERRRSQAEFIVGTASQALARPSVAVFMPFVLVHKNDPYALTEAADKPWPAWTEYARYTRENPWPERQVASLPKQANPVVLQWLADAATATGHKVAGAYRWRADGGPVRGVLRVYNFSAKSVNGRIYGSVGLEPGWDANTGTTPWRLPVPAHSRPAQAVSARLSIAPGEYAEVPVEYAAEMAPPAGEREWRQYWFEEPSGRRALVGFGLEQVPSDAGLTVEPLRTQAWGPTAPGWDWMPNRAPGEGRGRWQAINGVRVLSDRTDGLARFEVTRDPMDPIFPPMAALRLADGLRGYTHLRVSQRGLQEAVRVRVDLVDTDGRRFTIWENLGRARGADADASVWMALADFHPYAWGRLDGQRRLRLDEIREVQLRFYAPRAPAMVDVEIQLARPRVEGDAP